MESMQITMLPTATNVRILNKRFQPCMETKIKKTLLSNIIRQSSTRTLINKSMSGRARAREEPYNFLILTIIYP